MTAPTSPFTALEAFSFPAIFLLIRAKLTATVYTASEVEGPRVTTLNEQEEQTFQFFTFIKNVKITPEYDSL